MVPNSGLGGDVGAKSMDLDARGEREHDAWALSLVVVQAPLVEALAGVVAGGLLLADDLLRTLVLHGVFGAPLVLGESS